LSSTTCSNFPTQGEATESKLVKNDGHLIGTSQLLRVVVIILPKNEKKVKSRTILSSFVIILETYWKFVICYSNSL
jgi:hypothetical protein